MNWVGRIHGESVAASIKKNQLTLVKVSLPPDMTQAEYDAQTMLEKKEWDTKYTDFVKFRKSVNDSLDKLHAVLLGQCHSIL